ncbi:MAG: MBOAT family protein [Planctomycetes bacterium]|nr:MBOAT family protein [Planctomycetota bacterium]
MIFTEGRFFVLFLLCFLVHWSLRGSTARKAWLLACSCVFYGAWDVRFLALMFATLTLDYVIGAVLGKERAPGGRKLWLALSIAGNLGILGFFKYFGFFVDSAVAFSAWLGLPMSARTLDIVLPVGVSFYTFQSMSYTFDVYRRELKPAKSYLDFALFVTFFPQLVAGPIVRAVDFLPQLETLKRWADVAARPALVLFLVGFVKKACIADQVAPTVDLLFAHPEQYGVYSTWIGVVLYAVQIYCDFSGYSDMAIACAALLGYRLTLNFDFPYLATDITTFWRRWHISLSSWFRDYLYIPLGGNRVSQSRTYSNLALVFFLCGLWHGAKWTFVVWGLMHGSYLVLHRLWNARVSKESALARFGGSIGWILTPLAVLLAWVVFRAPDFGAAAEVWGRMLGAGGEASAAFTWRWAPFVAVLFAVHVLSRRRTLAPFEKQAPDWAFALAYGIAWAVALPWVATGTTPFIYFQF